MKARELMNLGVPKGPAIKAAQLAVSEATGRGMTRAQARDRLREVLAAPEANQQDPHFGPIAELLLAQRSAQATFQQRPGGPAPYRLWGEVGKDFDRQSLQQLAAACELPVAVRGALMPDAHVGYGLPIGGVLATRDAVIPYAVGVDIACRMKITVLDLPAQTLDDERGRDRLKGAIEAETRFGIGAKFRQHRKHDVMDRDWNVSGVTKHNKDRAAEQLGTSGSGNHFVEFGTLTVGEGEKSALGLEPGAYLALMSHSGSRGTGAAVCQQYSKLAMEAHPELPGHLRYLAWLDLDGEAGREYWEAMSLMGHYASANHEVIHREILRNLGALALAGVENHHNFAWEETHEIDGRRERVIVHRKGATPAGAGVLGVIPGSMGAPAFIVEGLGSADSLASAAHGAGRVMSRRQAKQVFAFGNVRRELAARGIEVISAGADESPGVYKDIHEVMARQQDLVRPVARFDPRLVKMAPGGERPED